MVYEMNNEETQSYEATNLAQVASGQYAKYVIDGGASLVNMTLEVGDFYCADGRIVKKNTSQLPDNVVGVVFKIGTTEAIRNANSCWSHAVVLAVKENTKAKWGNHASPTSAQNAAGWRYWYKDYGLADQNGVTDKSKLDESIMAEEGFETTKAWRAVPEPPRCRFKLVLSDRQDNDCRPLLSFRIEGQPLVPLYICFLI